MTRPEVRHYPVKRLTCVACGVFAPITLIPIDGILGQGTMILPGTICDICRQNRDYAVAS